MPKELKGEDKEWFDEHKVYRGLGTKKPKPKPLPVHVGYVEYDFLQNIYVIFKWVRTNNPTLVGRRFYYLLYLYPRGLFTKINFMNSYKPYGMKPAKVFNELLTDGWIKEWRGKSNGQIPLYDLSHKAKKLITKIHRVCTGEEKMSEDIRYNRLALENPNQRIDKYYMYAIKRLNKERNMDKDEFQQAKKQYNSR